MPFPPEIATLIRQPAPARLTTSQVRTLLDLGQAGHARTVARACRTWVLSVRPPQHRLRFWIHIVWFFCLQSDPLDDDQRAVADDLVDAAVRWGDPAAEAAARSCRALTAATLGRPAEGLSDLGRAAALLEALLADDAEVSEDFLYRCGSAANALALALMRQGIDDHALTWLAVVRDRWWRPEWGIGRRLIPFFNEGWVHLSKALESELRADPRAALDDFRVAGELFGRAVEQDRDHASELSPGAGLLALACRTLVGDAGARDELADRLSSHGYLRPDHEVVGLMALGRARAAEGRHTASAALVAAARNTLPADHSFRSLTLWVMNAGLLTAGASDTEHRSLLNAVLDERRRERISRAIAFQDALERERDRFRSGPRSGRRFPSTAHPLAVPIQLPLLMARSVRESRPLVLAMFQVTPAHLPSTTTLRPPGTSWSWTDPETRLSLAVLEGSESAAAARLDAWAERVRQVAGPVTITSAAMSITGRLDADACVHRLSRALHEADADGSTTVLPIERDIEAGD